MITTKDHKPHEWWNRHWQLYIHTVLIACHGFAISTRWKQSVSHKDFVEAKGTKFRQIQITSSHCYACLKSYWNCMQTLKPHFLVIFHPVLQGYYATIFRQNTNARPWRNWAKTERWIHRCSCSGIPQHHMVVVFDVTLSSLCEFREPTKPVQHYGIKQLKHWSETFVCPRHCQA